MGVGCETLGSGKRGWALLVSGCPGLISASPQMQCGQGFSQHDNGRCVGEWLLEAQVCLYPGCCSTAPRGHCDTGRWLPATGLSASYSCLQLQRGTSESQRALCWARRRGWHVAARSYSPERCRDSRDAERRLWPPGQRHGLCMATPGATIQCMGETGGAGSSKLSAQTSHPEDSLADTNECTEFPFICPRDKPICINTYGGYRCRSNKRCSRGFEPNEDGTACVGE